MHRLMASLFLAGSPLAAVGCGGGVWTYPVEGTPRDPGAEGTIQVERIEGDSRLVTLSLRHLAPPGRLGSGLTTFVVWLRDVHGRSIEASVIEYSAGSRTGRATATTSMPSFTVLVTAEQDAHAAQPSAIVVFSHRVTTD